MLKRIIMMLALGAALVACSPSGTGTSTDSVTPVDSAAPVDSGLPSEMPSESASPS